jgi:hypothetical protein
MNRLYALEKDDLSQEPENDPTWRESFAFHFYDLSSNIGFYTSMGERPYKNHSGAIIGVWGGEGTFVDNFIFDKVNRTDRIHRAAACGYECLEPLKLWRLSYKGLIPIYDERSIRIDPRKLTSSAASVCPKVPIEYDLLWEGISPCDKYKPIDSFWYVHLEQHGRVTGSITLGDKTYKIDAVGFRDRSYGIRNWLGVEWWTYVPTFFDEPFPLVGLMRWKSRSREIDNDGYIYRRDTGAFEKIAQSWERVERHKAEFIDMPVRVEIGVEGEKGTKTILKGEVIKIIPVVLSYEGRRMNRMSGLEGTCWIDRCLVKFEFDHGIFQFGEVELAKILDHPVKLSG